MRTDPCIFFKNHPRCNQGGRPPYPRIIITKLYIVIITSLIKHPFHVSKLNEKLHFLTEGTRVCLLSTPYSWETELIIKQKKNSEQRVLRRYPKKSRVENEKSLTIKCGKQNPQNSREQRPNSILLALTGDYYWAIGLFFFFSVFVCYYTCIKIVLLVEVAIFWNWFLNYMHKMLTM